MTGNNHRPPLYRFGQNPNPTAWPSRLVILGATGSIGTQTVDLVLRDPERLQVEALTAWSRVEELGEIVRQLEEAGCAASPWIAIGDPEAHERARLHPLLGRRLLPPGDAGVLESAGLDSVDCVVNGLVGAAGLAPTLAAAGRGRRIALANKEALVMGGDLVREAATAHGAEIIPVDSEHSALERLILTASGGPLRTWTTERMNRATRAEVLAHPTWEMGPKISVDSATLMNKGLEIIEAHVLFGVPYAEIDVVVHPGSIIHSLALFQDGAMMAQLGQPDMRVPLLYAISGERHEPLKTERLDLAGLGALHFEAPDDERFPCLNLARQAGEEGGVMTVGLNAANEVAVEAFLKDRISYPDIHTIIASTLDGLEPAAVTDLDHALSIDTWARQKAAQCLTVQGRGA